MVLEATLSLWTKVLLQYVLPAIETICNALDRGFETYNSFINSLLEPFSRCRIHFRFKFSKPTHMFFRCFRSFPKKYIQAAKFLLCSMRYQLQNILEGLGFCRSLRSSFCLQDVHLFTFQKKAKGGVFFVHFFVVNGGFCLPLFMVGCFFIIQGKLKRKLFQKLRTQSFFMEVEDKYTYTVFFGPSKMSNLSGYIRVPWTIANN